MPFNLSADYAQRECTRASTSKLPRGEKCERAECSQCCQVVPSNSLNLERLATHNCSRCRLQVRLATDLASCWQQRAMPEAWHSAPPRAVLRRRCQSSHSQK